MTIVCGREVELPDPKDNVAVVTYVRDRLLEQGCKSLNFRNCCQIRGENNCACAVGWLIPDAEYTESREFMYATLSSLEVLGYNRGLLIKMQNIHDTHFPDNWELLFDGLIQHTQRNSP